MITCFLNARDQVSLLRPMVHRLLGLSLDVVIIDNASTNPELLDYYETADVRVIRCRRNLGSRAGWICGAVDALATDYYLYSDTDLDLTAVPDDFPEVLKAGLDLSPWAICAGLSLDIDDLPASNPAAQRSIACEVRYWRNRCEGGFWRAGTDTTMALYRKGRGTDGRDFAIRSARPYTAKHLPWYYTKTNRPPDDYMYFLRNCCRHQSSNSDLLMQMLGE